MGSSRVTAILHVVDGVADSVVPVDSADRYCDSGMNGSAAVGLIGELGVSDDYEHEVSSDAVSVCVVGTLATVGRGVLVMYKVSRSVCWVCVVGVVVSSVAMLHHVCLI